MALVVALVGPVCDTEATSNGGDERADTTSHSGHGGRVGAEHRTDTDCGTVGGTGDQGGEVGDGSDSGVHSGRLLGVRDRGSGRGGHVQSSVVSVILRSASASVTALVMAASILSASTPWFFASSCTAAWSPANRARRSACWLRPSANDVAASRLNWPMLISSVFG